MFDGANEELDNTKYAVTYSLDNDDQPETITPAWPKKQVAKVFDDGTRRMCASLQDEHQSSSSVALEGIDPAPPSPVIDIAMIKSLTVSRCAESVDWEFYNVLCRRVVISSNLDQNMR
jgi:hypothetical protein